MRDEPTIEELIRAHAGELAHGVIMTRKDKDSSTIQLHCQKETTYFRLQDLVAGLKDVEVVCHTGQLSKRIGPLLKP